MCKCRNLNNNKSKNNNKKLYLKYQIKKEIMNLNSNWNSKAAFGEVDIK